MFQDSSLWQAWQAKYIRTDPIDIQQNFQLMDSMYEEARALGIFPLKNPVEGLNIKIKMVKVFHVSALAGNDRAGT